VLPIFVDGQIYGQTLVDVAPTSRLARFGLQSGDMIVAVDGTRITSAEASRYLWCRLGSHDVVELEVERTVDRTIGDPLEVELDLRE